MKPFLNRHPARFPLAILCFSLLRLMDESATAQSAVSLGTAGSFAVLGGSAVTDAGGSTFVGNVGVSPGTSITGIVGSAVTGGSIHLNDALAMQAHASAEAAYATLAGLDSDFALANPELGGLVLAPGVYTLASSAQLTGQLTLDGAGHVNPEWIFQIGSTLTTASDASVSTINGADVWNVFFQVGTSATLGTGTRFVGTILADQSITSTTDVFVSGRLLAINAAVTMGGTRVVIPEPSVAALAVLSLAGLSFRRCRESC